MSSGGRWLQQQLSTLSREWLAQGLPSFSALMDTADRLDQCKSARSISGVWDKGPVMVTATLDDSLGQGLQVIERYASVLGLTVYRAGLHVAPQQVLAACRKHRPHYLGLTVLQFDTETDIRSIVEKLAPDIRVITGGPVFSADPDLAGRLGIHYVARNLASFIDFMLKQPQATPPGGRSK